MAFPNLVVAVPVAAPPYDSCPKPALLALLGHHPAEIQALQLAENLPENQKSNSFRQNLRVNLATFQCPLALSFLRLQQLLPIPQQPQL